MPNAEKMLGERIRELRRRQFGPRGKGEFARLLSVSDDEYASFERGVVPPGDVLMRMCQVTGEDLQWLLTGVAARGTLVISGAKDRHQALLGRLARLLEDSPASAGPIEAFIDLLARGAQVRPATTGRLPAPVRGRLLPIFDVAELTDQPPTPDGPKGAWLAAKSGALAPLSSRSAMLSEPTMRGGDECNSAMSLITIATAAGSREFVDCSPAAVLSPDMFGVRVSEDALAPLLRTNDVALVSGRGGVRPGRPVLCKMSGKAVVHCRVWLGESRGKVVLGRLDTGAEEALPAAKIGWRMEVLYRVRAAA